MTFRFIPLASAIFFHFTLRQLEKITFHFKTTRPDFSILIRNIKINDFVYVFLAAFCAFFDEWKMYKSYHNDEVKNCHCRAVPKASLTRGEHEAGDKAGKENQLNFLSFENPSRKIPESILKQSLNVYEK